jgi:deoxyhypusine synthase
MKYTTLPFEKAKTYPLKNRKSKVSTDLLGKPFMDGSFRDFLSTLPQFLGAKDFQDTVSAIVKAKQEQRPVILGMGAHPVKVGLSPIIINLIEKGVISATCTNGACTIHDFELAFGGHTSEDVAAELSRGCFGMAEETGFHLNGAINKSVASGSGGIGHAVGKYIEESNFPYKTLSIFAAAYRHDIPATVHVAMGTDIIHMHPQADGALIGEGSMRDFRLLTSVVAHLNKGVYLNLGSAVILPEVFLKALNLARNLGFEVKELTTVNMDFIQHYRARENVLKRPAMDGGKWYALTGHHEIMFPLLAAAILDRLEE